MNHDEFKKEVESHLANQRAGRIMGAGEGPSQACCGTTAYRPNFRALIEDRINYHNRQANNLCALLRGLPQEFSNEAEVALADLIVNSKPRW